MNLVNGDTQILDAVLDALDVPESHYEKAVERYTSIGDWLHRAESSVAAFGPAVSVQGSFRYGTVNRPLTASHEYDLDLVCELKGLRKAEVTQMELKHLLGNEIKAYAKRYQVREPVTERNRCWRLDYADEVSFHIDQLPCVGEDPSAIDGLCGLGVPRALAELSVAITDRRHPEYGSRTQAWPSSNPRGLGRWFKARAESGVALEARKSIEQVPAYSWKTPLQRSIQILKRHRDVMFMDAPEIQPISMIITVLAAQAYVPQPTLFETVLYIVGAMPSFVGRTWPRIPNPVNPAEDFADRWLTDPRREKNFWRWLDQVNRDLTAIQSADRSKAVGNTERAFNVTLGARVGPASVPAVARSAVREIELTSPPKPWGTSA